MTYSIEGTPLPVVICNLESGETMITEKGGMAWMSPNMQMETVGGGVGKMFGRAFSGEAMFQNRYTARGNGMIAFASSMPGQIRAFEIMPGSEIICQKSAFLASTAGVELSVHFNKKAGAGFFGGEGFIMQKLSGRGIAFVELDGYIKEYELAPGQQLIIDTGYLAAMESTVSLDIQSVQGLKNKFFGGEGFFNTCITGPGKVWIQSMPISNLAGSILPFIPQR
ncbi:MAG: TIGR00266 family protein [Eubacterium sp.]|nr:TIGR00266 family protein [Eubacterium sp.]